MNIHESTTPWCTTCEPDNHKQRDNTIGVTWCVKCGRLFTKPCNKPLLSKDKMVIVQVIINT